MVGPKCSDDLVIKDNSNISNNYSVVNKYKLLLFYVAFQDDPGYYTNDLFYLVVIPVYVAGSILSVNNGYYAGNWTDVDECPSWSYAGGFQLKVKYCQL